jgi:hypothetical protein
VCTTVLSNSHDIEDVNCGGRASVEVWSFGAATLSKCTQAMGWQGEGPFPDPGDPVAKTDTRC